MSHVVPGSERLIVVVGPSGAGKDSVIAAWLSAQPASQRPHRARRTITRAADVHEDHEPLDAASFAAAAAAGAFAFDWQAHGLHYGIRHAELAALAAGGWVAMNGSRGHLPRLRLSAPLARVVEIDAPAGVRALRLRSRGREAAAEHPARLAREVDGGAAALRVLNAGRLEEAVATLDGWWRDTTRA